jgi:hypothetical protein
VNLLAGIFAFEWTDGNPVHMLYTADGLDQLTTVSHQIGKGILKQGSINTVYLTVSLDNDIV